MSRFHRGAVRRFMPELPVFVGNFLGNVEYLRSDLRQHGCVGGHKQLAEYADRWPGVAGAPGCTSPHSSPWVRDQGTLPGNGCFMGTCVYSVAPPGYRLSVIAACVTEHRNKPEHFRNISGVWWLQWTFTTIHSPIKSIYEPDRIERGPILHAHGDARCR